jgi:dipeptidyl aminopeptidase/acylaminoacyl peptidase
MRDIVVRKTAWVIGKRGRARPAPSEPIGIPMKHDDRGSLNRWPSIVLSILLAPAVCGIAVAGAQGAAAGRVTVASWLVLGPIPTPVPAFAGESQGKSDPADLLEYEHLRIRDLKPAPGATVPSFGGDRFTWTATTSDTSGIAFPQAEPRGAVAYAAAYVEVPRWTKVEIESRSTHPVELFVDGVSLFKQKAPHEWASEAAKNVATAKLVTGKHLIVVKTACVAGEAQGGWRLAAAIAPAKGFEVEPVVSIDPTRRIDVRDVLEAPAVDDVRLSPDGRFASIVMSRKSPPDGKSEKWVEVRRFDDGRLMTTLRDVAAGSNWQWAPVGHRLSYMASGDDGGTLRVLDIDTGASGTIVTNIKELSDYTWARDGSFVVYSAVKKAAKDETGVKRLEGVYDRREGERDKTFLYLATVPEGMTRVLTGGDYSSVVCDVHPGGASLLVARTCEDLSMRPYSTTELVQLDLSDQGTKVLWKGQFFSSAVWSPDGRRILVTAGPSAFGSEGVDLAAGAIPNDYDTQAYLFDPETGIAEPITRKFGRTIERAYWAPDGSHIFFVAQEADYVRLYQYGLKSRKFEAIELPCDVVLDSDVASARSAVIVYGSSATHPPRLVAVDAGKRKGRVFDEPDADRFRDVALGTVGDWSFTSKAGRTIDGRIHYPPGFDANKSWPCIVYYYGGTSPVDRSFGGRYPKDLWAAHGYVVYVLQPSGATGFGQDFSAAHVNDWGKIVSEEIIEGVKAFLDAHPFVDRKRVGCIGASFGGFMTELLVTKTDMFAAAVSHAGISSITSYWGEGYWGYDYNAVSAAGSFPWNRPDIYVGQSPLFAADKITTPLLLLHGTADTNVPPGESEQMYTALKLLGKPVEYIRIEGQNHFVLEYKKRIAWSDAIIAWFDKWLKGEPQWWEDMYPPIPASGILVPSKLGLKKSTLEKHGVVLFGEVTRGDVEREIPGWGADSVAYVPDPAVLERLAGERKDVHIVCVFGTWCSDSKREVPRLWKILDATGIPESSLEMYAVASSRFTADMLLPPGVLDWSKAAKSKYGVSALPTIIVERSGAELGRVVEKPKESLEEDLSNLISGATAPSR